MRDFFKDLSGELRDEDGEEEDKDCFLEYGEDIDV